MNCEAWREFRQQAYKMLGQAQDATFELMDAVMTTPKANCLTLEFRLTRERKGSL